MAAIVSAAPPLSPPGVGDLDHADSNISSPLSEVDDKDENEEDIEHMQLDMDDDDQLSKPSTASKKAASDSDSVLSDAHSDLNSDGNDTEAETERLFDTPKHQRQRDVVVDQYNEGQVFEHTPSKLRRTANLADNPEHPDDESLSGDDASIGSPTLMDDSPTKPAIIKDIPADNKITRDSQERKRKRSPAADLSELEQPLRKRTSSGLDHDSSDPKQVEDAVMHEDEPTPANDSSGTQTPAEDGDSSPRKKTTAHEDDVTERTTRATKKKGRSGSKRKAAVPADVDHETDGGSHDGVRDGGTDGEHHGDEADADVEEEVDAATTHDEEVERKHAAYRDWTQIEDMFGVFRDRLYKDRLQRLEEEEQSLLAAVPSHPEYLNMKQCLDDRLEQKLREINKELDYRTKAHERKSVAQRAQIWGQYFQGVREKREKTLEALNQEWYDVQTARRSAHSLQDCGLLFPKDPAQRIRNAVAYNTEVSTLASIAKYEGFPAGPLMKGASASELEDDLAAIERARRGRNKQPVQSREDYHSPSFDRIDAAGEQFLRETPWANPNHLAHKMYPNLNTTGEGRSENASGRGTQQGLVPPADIKSPFTGSKQKQQASPALSNRLSESPELTRSALNPAHHQMKRVGGLPSINRGPKTAAA